MKTSKEALKVAGMNKWMTDRYNLDGYQRTYEGHQHDDNEVGFTCIYCWPESRPEEVNAGFNYLEMKSLVKTLDRTMWGEKDGTLFVNQHAVHSLRQFMCNVQDQWNKHSERLTQLLGTPSGRLPIAQH